MCEVCHCIICPPACPNSEDPKTYGLCASCEEDIIFGDDRVVVDEDNNIFCDEECLMDYYGRRALDWSNEFDEDEH